MSKFIREEEVITSGEEETKVTTYEKCFTLRNDPLLLAKGIEICARTVYDNKDKKTTNRVLFIKDNRKVSEIDCIHTKVCILKKVPLSDQEKEMIGIEPSEEHYEILSTERHPEIKREIDPSQQYIALKSFVGHLVEEGIENSIIDSMKFKLELKEGNIDVGQELLDSTTTTQLIRAISEIEPTLSENLSLSALEFMSADQPERLQHFSEDFRPALCNLKQEGINRLESIDGGILQLSDNVKRCIASNPYIPKNVMNEFAKSDDNNTLINLARNVNLPSYLIRNLATHHYESVRSQIAVRQDLPADIIEFLSRDKMGGIVENLLKSQPIGKISVDDLTRLSGHEDVGARMRLAMRSDLPKDAIEKLVHDNPLVTRVLAENKIRLPSDSLVALRKSPDVQTRIYVAKRNDLPQSILKKWVDEEFNDTVQSYLALRPDISSEQLDFYINYGNSRVRKYIANYRKNLSESQLIALSRDLDSDVRKDLVLNDQKFPRSVLIILLNDRVEAISRALYYRKDLPDDIRREVELKRQKFFEQRRKQKRK